jgi:hypothetical protein
MQQVITLAVGQGYHLKRGKDHIVYAGMLSDDVYSIIQIKASGYQGYSWSLFFRKSHQYITIDGINISVENVTPEEISFRLA